MALKTVEDILELLSGQKTITIRDPEDLLEMIATLAREVKELKRTVTAQKFLIEHEEKVRTTKAPTPIRTRAEVFKKGEIVERLKHPGKTGKVVEMKNGRVLVAFGPQHVWVSPRSIVHHMIVG